MIRKVKLQGFLQLLHRTAMSIFIHRLSSENNNQAGSKSFEYPTGRHFIMH